MFTGIVVALGTVSRVERTGEDARFTFASPALEGGRLAGHPVAIGDSICVSGCCLTVTGLAPGEPSGARPGSFVADVSGETLACTTLGRLTPGAQVNLEPALTPASPLGGHIVTGHVDGTGALLEAFPDGRSTRMRFALPAALSRYVARKGSITVDGVSLTVNEAGEAEFGVNLIPHTLEVTTLGALTPGQAVNLEVDLLARYLERLLEARQT